MSAQGPAARDARRWGVALFALLVAGVTLGIYRPAMSGGFYFDDLQNIVHAPAVHWRQLSLDGVAELAREAFLPRRLVANLTFALNHLQGGLEPAGYHWTNLVLHLGVGAALFWVVLLYLRRARSDPPDGVWRATAALAAVALFLWHPLNTQAVSYVVQRMTLLAALCSLLALGCYLAARTRPPATKRAALFVASGLCWLLGVASKEIALALPLVLLLYELCFHLAGWRAWYRARRRRALWLIGLAAPLLALGGYAVWLAADNAWLVSWQQPLAGRPFSGAQRLLSEARAQFFYLGLLLWPAPSRLTLEHDFAHSASLLQPWTTAVALIGLALLAAAAVWLGRRWPRYGFPLLAYGALHLIESGPINLELIFEHRMYLPLTMLALLAATLLADLRRRPTRTAALIACALLALPLSLATARRNAVWGDPVAFHRDCARKAPDKFRPQYNLGTLLGPRGRYEEAERALRRALAIDPRHSMAHNQLANVLSITGRHERALGHYRAAVRHDPRNAEALFNLARLLDGRGRTAEATPLYRRFLQVAPRGLARHRRWVEQRLAR